MVNDQRTRYWRDDILEVLNRLDGEASLQEIYVEMEKVRANLKGNWHASISKTISENSSDSKWVKGKSETKHDLFYKASRGVWGIREFSAPPNPPVRGLGSEEILERPKRTPVMLNRIDRKPDLAERVKNQHKNKCQLCGEALALRDGVTYSEAHHLQPLGKPHDGYDVEENLIVLCPNCHVKCDWAAVEVPWGQIKERTKHPISKTYVDYHNARYRGEKKQTPETMILVDKE